MRNEKLVTSIKVSLLSVMAFVLMFVDMPVPMFPTFLKIDISDLPALLGALALGPVQGVLIELLKNILHGIFKGGTGFVGELANFLVGSMMVATAAMIYRRDKSRTNAIKAMVISVVVMSIGASVLNYFLILPLYEKVLGFPMKAIVGMGSAVNAKIIDLNTFVIWAILPFNILKGIVVSVMTLAVYKKVSPILHKEEIEGSAKAQIQKN